MFSRHLAVEQDYFLAIVAAAFQSQPKEGEAHHEENNDTYSLNMETCLPRAYWTAQDWNKIGIPPFISGTVNQDQHVWLGMLPTGDVNGYIQPFAYFLRFICTGVVCCVSILSLWKMVYFEEVESGTLQVSVRYPITWLKFLISKAGSEFL